MLGGTPPAMTDQAGSGLSAGAIGGIVGGVLGVLLLALVAMTFYLLGRRSGMGLPSPSPVRQAVENQEESTEIEGANIDREQSEDIPVGGRLRYPNDDVTEGGRLALPIY